MGGSRLRDYVDSTTGELHRVETTKQAKRRHRVSGGAQWKPTRGQINAADIWNKQEEKIKRDKEREERKKKNVIRQSEKDARLKEIQEEMLRKGRITIEDTWGKVSASQNRLHRFFGAPTTAAQERDVSLERCKTDGQRRSMNDQVTNENQAQVSGPSSRVPIHPGQVDFETLLGGGSDVAIPKSQGCSPASKSQTSSPCRAIESSPLGRKRKRDQNEGEEMSLLSCQRIRQDPSRHADEKRVVCYTQSMPSRGTSSSSISPTAMMPPPPPPRPTLTLSPSNYACSLADHLSQNAGQSPIAQRVPLSHLSESDLNIRATHVASQQYSSDELSRLVEKHWQAPLSTQILRETVIGLSSQDLMDDFVDDDKENLSPLRGSEGKCSIEASNQPSSILRSVNIHMAHPTSTTVSSTAKASRSHSDLLTTVGARSFNEFDDCAIDDEALVALAATQRLKENIFEASDAGTTASTPDQEMNLGQHDLLDEGKCALEHTDPDTLQVSSESFALSGIDDDDLRGCVEDFEFYVDEDLNDGDLLLFMDTFDSVASKFDESLVGRSTTVNAVHGPRKGRILPWDKNPIHLSQMTSESEGGSSQKTVCLDDCINEIEDLS